MTISSQPLASIVEPACADVRQTPLYDEAETIFRTVLNPGSGLPVGAVDVSASPDGSQIVFTGTLLESLDTAPAMRVCLTDLETGTTRVMSAGPNLDLSPKFSPDGRQLAFRSDREAAGNFQIYLIDLMSGETFPAPRLDGWVETFAFSPDSGSLLALVAEYGADVAAVHGGTTSKRAASSDSPNWLPVVETDDETHGGRSAWIVGLSDGKARRVSPDDLNIWEASWCGNEAIAAVASAGAGEAAWYSADLVRIAVTDGKAERLYRPKDQLGWVSGSPDGRRVAIVEAVCSDRGLCAGDVLIVDIDDGNVRRVSAHGIDASSTIWRSNDQLLIAGIRNLETVVAEVAAETGTVVERWASDELYSASPHYPQAAPCGDDGIVLPVVGHRHAPHLLYIDNQGGRVIANFQHQGSDRILRKLPEVRPYRWTALDGTEMQGWLMRSRAAGPAPLIMEIHGGPIWRWPPFFLGRSAYYAMLAERGYAMFWPNPRGSSGRGQDFARAVVGDMGGADALDCLSGIDSLVADGIADADRLGVMGHSYGGFMVSWLVTQDQRFAAAISSAPITNWTSFRLTTNIPYFVQTYLEEDFNGDNYQARSPVTFAHQARTPTLNMCGALDRCSPPGQAEEFHNALRQNRITSMLVTYPEEGHGIRSFPAMIDHSARIADWFIRYMPSGGRQILP